MAIAVPIFFVIVANDVLISDTSDDSETIAMQIEKNPESEIDVKTEKLTDLKNDITSKYSEQNLSVVAFALDGSWNFEINADEVWPSASLYKLFIAYSMAQAVSHGDWSWHDYLGGERLDACLYDMIVKSDNYCPEAWLASNGHSVNEVNDFVHEIGGLEQTRLAWGDMTTSANDVATFLGKIYRGDILDGDARQMILDAMRNQIYRDGIPAGVDGTAADKVGFLDDLLHDAGIIFSPNGDYVLVIMTAGSSWSEIAEIAGKIDAVAKNF